MTKYNHYIIPAIISLFITIISYFNSDYILEIIQTLNLKTNFFTISLTLFGLVLTAYGIFFGIVPLLKPEIQKSKTLESVSKYFFMCLLTLLLLTILNLLFIFTNNLYVFLLTTFLFLYVLCMFFYIVGGLKSLFKIIRKNQ